MSRVPQPGHVTIASGLSSGPIADLQRGQFMRSRPGAWQAGPGAEYNLGMRTPMERPRNPDLAARLFGGKPEATLALLRAAWPGAVGEELARRTEVVALDGGVLRIKVPDMRWQRTLVRMRGFILSRLSRVAGQAAPRALGFVTGEVPDRGADAPAAAVPEVVPPPPLVAEAALSITDLELRSGFTAAAGRYLARFGPTQAGSADGSTGGPAKGSAGGSGEGSTGS